MVTTLMVGALWWCLSTLSPSLFAGASDLQPFPLAQLRVDTDAGGTRGLVQKYIDSTTCKQDAPTSNATGLSCPVFASCKGNFTKVEPIWAMPVELMHAVVRLIQARRINHTLEVGAGFGSSSAFFVDAQVQGPRGRHTVVDLFSAKCESPTWQVMVHSLVAAGASPHFQVFPYSSALVLPALLKQKMSYGFISIDGHHTFEMTIIDLMYADALLVAGGYLMFDDCQAAWKGTSLAIHLFDTRYVQGIDDNGKAKEANRLYQYAPHCTNQPVRAGTWATKYCPHGRNPCYRKLTKRAILDMPQVVRRDLWVSLAAPKQIATPTALHRPPPPRLSRRDRDH